MNAPQTESYRYLNEYKEIVLSVVIPLYNERVVLPLLEKRLRKILDSLHVIYEIVFVDDGSHDGSTDFIFNLAAAYSNVTAISLSRNFGKESALTAGLQEAMGAAVVVLDADLQDPPELIPEMMEAWRQGADVVCMKRRIRNGEAGIKQWSAYLYYRLLNRISQVRIPEDTGDFRLMSRRALDSLNRLPERNRYMKGLFAWIGYPTTVIEYDRDERAAGNTKWNFLKLFSLAIEGITSFSTAPLRLMTTMGFLTALIGAIFGIWIVVKTILVGSDVQGYPSLVAIVTFLGGIQLLSIGVVGEYVGKVYSEAKQRPLYLISKLRRSAPNPIATHSKPLTKD